MKITIEEGPEAMSLKLEGKVTGAWVREFSRSWQSLAPSLKSRKLVVDLRGVMHMDTEGRRLLSEIYNQTGAELLADSPMTHYFADEARRHSSRKTKEEK